MHGSLVSRVRSKWNLTFFLLPYFGKRELFIELVYFETPSGRLNVNHVSPTRETGKAILCIHGFCCDSRIFGYISKLLASAGYEVYSLDLPGHGTSAGRRGDVDFDKCLQSIDFVISEIKKKSSDVFVVAHSMGSTFALWHAHRFKNSIKGLVLLSPYIRIRGIKRSEAEPSFLAFLYLMFGRLFSPKKQVDIRKVLPGYARIGGSQYDRMANQVKINFDYTFRYLIDIVAQRNAMLGNLSEVNVPTLILYGQRDRNVFPQVSEEFFKILKSNDKQIASIDCNHWFYDAVFFSQSEEYSENDRLAFVNRMISWLDKSSGSTTHVT
jgi:alpha-beta hydrolase superfamily lysophospholipase